MSAGNYPLDLLMPYTHNVDQDDKWLEIQAESENYLDLPPDHWPPIKFNWDTSEEGMRFTVDGFSIEKFREEYPRAFRLAEVSLTDFDKKLCNFSRRDSNEELWELGNSSKLAFLIAYLRRGMPITPPLLFVTEQNELMFRGGHHRYAAAKASRLAKIKIYVEHEHVSAVENLVAVSWLES